MQDFGGQIVLKGKSKIKWFSGGNMRGGGASHHQQSIEGDFRDRKNITEPNGDQVNVFMTRATKLLQPRPPPPSLTQTINDNRSLIAQSFGCV